MIFKRKIYERLLEWKKCEGKEALMIEGARRVGKSTIVKEFAHNEYESFLLIDFDRTSMDIYASIDLNNLPNDLEVRWLHGGSLQEKKISLYQKYRNKWTLFEKRVRLWAFEKQSVRKLLEGGENING